MDLPPSGLSRLAPPRPPSRAGGPRPITLHEAGKAGGAYTVHEAWPPGKSAADIAKLVAHRIVGEYKSHVGQVFKGITLDF